MTPDFALNLSLDGISLLHRSDAGWVVLGEVSLDDPNLASGLDLLRAKAIEAGGADFVTKVVVPSSQVLFAVLRAEPNDEAVRTALKGRTYQPLEELAIDWQVAPGGRVRIAAVARETLAEAVQFAADSGFRPVAQVASPFDEQYDGEAWFGPVVGAEDLIERVGAPERGSKAVGTLWQKDLPVPAVDAVIAPTDEPVEAGEAVPDAEASGGDTAAPADVEPDIEAPTLLDTDPVPVIFAHRDVEALGSSPRLGAASRDGTDDQSAPRLGAAREIREIPAEEIEENAAPAEPVVSRKRGKADAKAEIETPSEPAVFVPSPLRGTAGPTNVEMPAALAKRLGVSITPQGRSIPGAPQAPKPAFNPFGAKARPVQKRRNPATLAILMGGLVAAGAAFWIWAEFLPPLDGQIGLNLDDQFVEAQPLGDGADVSEPIDPDEVQPLANAPEIEAEALADGEDAVVSEPIPADVATLAETDAALEGEPQEPLPENTAALANEAELAETPNTNEAPDGERADGIHIAAVDPVVPEPDAIALSLLSPDAPVGLQVAPLPFGTVLDLDERGLVKATPEGTLSPLGVLVFSGPAEVSPQPRPQSVMDAAIAAGVARSLTTPEAPVEGVELPPSDGTAPVTTPLESQDSDPLFQFKPIPRPGQLQETTERAVLGGLTRTELAAYVPAPRPSVVPEVSVEASPVVVGELNGNEYAPALSSFPQRKPANIAAIAANSTPTINADDAVTAALGTLAYEPNPERASSRQPEPDRSASAASPDEEGDEAVADVVPSIPTSASVAKQATVKNAIDLGEVQLVGVFGSPAQRRAYVRMPNGKMTKVKVGDRLDGGKVIAISDSQLQYTKKSRTITLALPRV